MQENCKQEKTGRKEREKDQGKRKQTRNEHEGMEGGRDARKECRKHREGRKRVLVLIVEPGTLFPDLDDSLQSTEH